MLGLFDSGSGGLNTVRYIKRNLPTVDLVYFIDRFNSPYGIKSEKELTEIVSDNIDELAKRGAKKVLIACCTASTVHCLLDEKYKRISIPIIEPVARRASKLSKTKRIGVIGTQRTVLSHAFKEAMSECHVAEVAAQELVRLIDNGLNDESVTSTDKKRLAEIISPLKDKNIDTLILGCTHFPALKKSFSEICRSMGIENIIDSAEVGAMELIRQAKKEK